MNVEAVDRLMMGRCIGLSKASGKAGEYPYAAVVCRDGTIVAQSINMVTHDGDVTRHSELVAISQAQKALGTVSLEDCEIYTNAEPCALCSYAIRETRIRRVVFGLSSPHMGGVSKWNILVDTDICSAMPEVFAPPPEVISGYMAKEAEQALIEWNPLIAGIIRRRGLFGTAPRVLKITQPPSLRGRVLRCLRRNLFDYFGRR
ncbi:MAG TPA: nucleoside deaminase [Bradyrhizobium sp.]|nr:nucleoside deaminase [Bradyrhizobium sp.]